MTPTTKVIIAIIIVAAIGIVVYRMPGNGGDEAYQPTDTVEEAPLTPATGNADDVVSALFIDAESEQTLATDEDDSDLVTSDSQALIDVSNAYAENDF